MVAAIGSVGRCARLALATLAGLGRPPFYPQELVRALREAGGPHAMLPVVLMLATIGAIAALQGVTVLRLFGADRLLAGILAEVTVRDLAPTMTALMLAAHAGTAIAGEIGAMRVSEETDALRAIGVDPVRYLCVPKLLSLVLVCPLATGLGTASALGAAYVAAVFAHGATAGTFVAGLAAHVSVGAVAEAGWKAAAFGYVCGLLACFHGLEARGGSEGVGRAVNATIVGSIILVAGAEAALTLLFMRVAT